MILKAYFLRNEQTDAEGRQMKYDIPPNWRNEQNLGYIPGNFRRGYVAGDSLTLVNRQGVNFGGAAWTDTEIAESMYALYNRGSGQEREFDGPSMSIGDLVAVVRGQTVTLLQVASGWRPVPTTPEIIARLVPGDL